MIYNKIFFDIYTSINEDKIKKNNITNENIVCLIISTFMFSLLLFFIIELCNFIPLTAKLTIQGIKNRFCNISVETKNNIPFQVPQDNIIEEIVYPKQNPLKPIIKYTIDIPNNCRSHKP